VQLFELMFEHEEFEKKKTKKVANECKEAEASQRKSHGAKKVNKKKEGGL